MARPAIRACSGTVRLTLNLLASKAVKLLEGRKSSKESGWQTIVDSGV